MLQNAYLLAKIGADTAENEQHFAKNCQRGPPRRGRPAAAPGGRRRPRAAWRATSGGAAAGTAPGPRASRWRPRSAHV